MPNDLYETRSHSDVVHRTIPYSGLENKILATKPLLRLHRVSQNSLVFLTFSPNKVKRFEHSLGVMHLAGKLFQSAMSNTSTEVIESMLNLFGDELTKWINLRRTKLDKKLIYGEIFENSSNYTLKNGITPQVGLYYAHTPPHIPSEWGLLYTALYQGVRIAGLLHDVGHLPYSHTIEEVLGILFDRWERVENKEPIQKLYLKRVRTYVNQENSGTKLHEAITIRMIPIIEEECMKSVKKELEQKSDIEKNGYLAFCLYSFEIARRILDTNESEKSIIFRVLHRIISGTLDADRLDYVSRDLLCSGVSNDIINYERLFMFLSFEQNRNQVKEENKENPILLTVASKTVGDIEEFLRKRWRSYRDINYHHSVHKSELLMRGILLNLAECSVKSSKKQNNEENESQDMPEDFLQGILLVLKALAEEVNESKITDVFLRLDDAWLDTLLKKSKNKNDMVDELAFGRTSYLSVVKRFEDYFIIDEKVYNLFLDYVKKSDDQIKDFFYLSDCLDECIDSLQAVKEECSYKYIDRSEYLQSIIHDMFGLRSNYTRYVFANKSFVINDIINTLDSYLAISEAINEDCNEEEILIKYDNHYYKKKFFYKLNEMLLINDNSSNPSVMLGVINLQDGIGNDCYIRRSGKTPELFTLYSGLKNYLYAESMLLPMFHFYCKTEVDIEEKKDHLSNLIYQILKEDILKYANDLLIEMKDKLT